MQDGSSPLWFLATKLHNKCILEFCSRPWTEHGLRGSCSTWQLPQHPKKGNELQLRYKIRRHTALTETTRKKLGQWLNLESAWDSVHFKNRQESKFVTLDICYSRESDKKPSELWWQDHKSVNTSRYNFKNFLLARRTTKL